LRTVYNIFKFILSHPLGRRNKTEALKRFIFYQASKIFNPYPIVYAFTDKAKLIIEKGMTGATGNIYCGLHEFEDMGFLLHFLRPGDLFIDVGANVGSYTVLASAHIGCETIAFEPVPSTFERLQNNISINHIEQIAKAFNLGIGAKKGELKFTTDFDTVNHVATEDEEAITTNVYMESLDSVLAGRNPILIKIDVEGFEKQVLEGSRDLLTKESLSAIIIELNGSGEKYGNRDTEIHSLLLDAGFAPYQYSPFERSLNKLVSFGKFNTLYLRNHEKAKSRVENGETFESLGLKI
jgi:FkbM family methyltransferase